MKPSKTWVEISKSALTQNVRAFRRHVGDKTAVMAVVKSNAYGHGLVEVAKIADKEGAAWFGVDNVDEAIQLRKNGIRKPILVLGYTLNERLRDCVTHRISFVVYNLETVKALRALKLQPLSKHPKPAAKAAFVHIKIETGTTRQGVSGDELKRLVRELKKTPGVVIEGASTHFANIEDTTDHSYAEQQLQRFQDGLSVLSKEGINPAWKHAACSAATVLFPDTYFNLVRLGVSMYGLWSSKETLAVAKNRKEKLDLQPVMTWKTVIAQVKRVKKGTPVSYGLTERANRDSVLAIIPVGYWDGFDRKLSGSATVLVRGHRCKVMGRVCMNMCVIDVTDVPGVRVEDEVVLLGRQKNEVVSAEDIASKIGSINYEIVTRVNPLLPRVVVR
ncbi:MAG: alanine racemase [Patescibacteria group bacterium]|jgi:alanine racemase